MLMEFVQMNGNDWCEKYKPIINPKTGSRMFEFSDLKSINSNYIWTMCDLFEDGAILVPGFGKENRMFHYISSVPIDGLEWVHITDENEDEDEFDDEDED